MAVTKKMLIIAVVSAIIVIDTFTIVLDFSRFLGLYSFYNAFPNELIKRINVVLAAALVWFAYKDSLSKGDNRLMSFTFVTIFIGEYFFLTAKPAYAITAFFLCQYLLTIRHSKGLFKGLSKAAPAQKLKLALTSVMFAGIIAATVIRLYPFGSYYDISIIAITYWTMLSISVWTAQANFTLGLFPKANAKMAAIGMICFYFCDICVGLDGILGNSMLWLWANSLIWVFYTPAITLLALSCYKYKAKKNDINKILLSKTRALK